MPRFVDTLLIDGRPVEVTMDYPENAENITNVQALAEKAWRSVNKEIVIGAITVKVRAV